MKLVIAEKPSVAKSLAAVLGAVTRKDGYLEGGGWLVSWCLGHLAGLADAATRKQLDGGQLDAPEPVSYTHLSSRPVPSHRSTTAS